MSMPTPAESRRSYSWWWGSHISPKNSKWLQENLADMDTKVKAMIKLIDEDADSFARRAEMYYKKRPELMNLVEEFYRAYRALAERYDHATGALRHAHQTMAEAFPNHIPLALPDESSPISSGAAEAGSYTPEKPSLIRALFDPDDMQKEAFGGAAYFNTVDRNRVYAEENESIAAKKGLKQLNEMFAPREATSRANLHEGKVRKGLSFQEEEEKVPCPKIHMESKILLEPDAKEKEDDRNEIKRLQQEVSQLSNENQHLKSLAESEFMNLDCFRTEVQNLRDAMSKLLSEKEAVIFKNHLDCKIMSTLEAEIIKAKDIFGELQEEIIIGTVKLVGAEEECLALEKAIQSLKLDLEEKKKELEETQVLWTESQKLLEQEVKEKENARNEVKSFQEELSQTSIENHNRKSKILSESMHLHLSTAEVQNMRDAMLKLGPDNKTVPLQNQLSQERICSLETEIFQTKDEIGKLHDDILIRTAKLCGAEEQCLALERTNQIIKLDLEEWKRVLEELQWLSVEKQNLLEKEVDEKENARNEIKCLQEELSQVSVENEDLKSQNLSVSMHLQSSRAEVQNMRNAMLKLGSEKEAAVMHNQQSLESISNLETEIFQANDEIWKLHEDIMMRIIKLCSTEEQCLALEKENHNLKVDAVKKEKRLEQIQMLTVEKQNLLEKEVSEKKNAINEIKCLQKELSDVSIENQDIKSHIVSESMHLQSSRAEVEIMRNAMFKLGSEKEGALMQNKISLESISNLETEIIQANDEIQKLHENIKMGIIKLCSAEEQCFALEKENRTLKLDLEEKKKGLEQMQMLTIEKQNLFEKEVKEKVNAMNGLICLQEEFSQVIIDNQNLKSQIVSESLHLQSSRAEVQNIRNAMLRLKSEKVAALVQNQLYLESISNFETEIIQSNDEIQKLHEDIMMGIIKLCDAEEQCLSMEKENQSLRLELEEKKKGLEQIQMISIEKQNLLEKEVKDKENARNEIKCLQEELSRVSILNQLSKESLSNLGTEISLAKDEIVKLQEDIVAGIVQLCSAEERCLAMDKANQSLKLDLEEKRKALEEAQLLSVENQNLLEQEIKEKLNARNELKCLQGNILQLTVENHNLKSQIESESKHLDASRTEVQHLKVAMSKLECEREVQNQLYCDSIAILETKIFRAEDEIRELHEEALMGIVKMFSAEEQHTALVRANHSLKLVVEERKRELEELRTSLQEIEKQNVEVERSLLSREKQYNLSQEKVENMTLEIKAHSKKLKDIEQSKVDLEEEVQQLKDINYNLNKNILSCDFEVKNLQEEIASLKESNSKFEYEVNIHWEDRKILQHELDSIKDNRNEVDLKNKILIEQMEVARLNIDSLETLVKELQFAHAELIESCRKLEGEKNQIFNKLKDMEAISEKNVFLKNSLFDATTELEEQRENIRVLEDSCEALTAKVSSDASERAALASLVEVLSENVEKLSDKNTLLENSLADANTELEGLRSKLRELEESIQFISDENSNILTQKNDLFSQVESIQHNLADLDTRHAMLVDKHANLEKEKVFLIAQVLELEDALKIKKKEHESLIHSSKICMVNLENQIHVLREDRVSREEEFELIQQKCISCIIEILVLQRCLCDMKGTLRTEMQKHESLIQSSEAQQTALQSQIQFLQEQRQIRDEEFEEEQQKSVNSMLEIFILRRCLSEMNQKNFVLSRECQRHLEASKCAIALISQLKGSKLLLKEKVAILEERNSKLRDAVNKLLDLLHIDKKLMSIDGDEEAVLQTILCGIRNLLDSISDVHDENQLIHMELTVHCTLLKQIGLENIFLDQELGRMNRQLLVLQEDHHQLFVKCEKFEQDANYRDCMNEALKAELESLCRQLSDLSEEFCKLKAQNNALEEENSVMLRDALTLEHLYLFFRSSNAGNMQYLKLFGNRICSLSAIKNDHEKDIRETKDRLKVMENENKQLKNSLVLLEELRSQVTILEFDLFTTSHFCEELVLQVEIGENLLKKKSMELLRAYRKLQCTQEEVAELCSKLHATYKEVDEAKMIRLELEEKITVLLEGHAYKNVEIDNCCEENRMLNKKLNRLNDEVELLRKREHLLSTELQEKIEEIGKCEGEISKLLHEVQFSAVDGIVLEEKMHELAFTFEGLDICALVQMEVLKQSNAYAFELKKKLDDLESDNRQPNPIQNACLPLFISLGNGIATVEKQAHQLVKLHRYQDNPSSYHQEERNETRTVDHTTMVGVLELQNLISKVEALQKLMIDTNSQLAKERLQYIANLEAARREIEGFKKEINDRQEKQGKETSRGKNGQLMKDIELDQVSNSNSNGPSRIQSAESEDQMLKLWETVDRDYSNSVSNVHDIEAVDELSEQLSSEIVAEKELGVDKQEISREMKESQEEWSIRISERLSSNAGKLFALQTSAQELKEMMERTAKNHHRSSEHDAISTKLKEAVEQISELADVDVMLRKKVEEGSKMCNDEVWCSERSQISEQTRKLVTQTEKLEFELQKIQHIFPKLEEESDSNRTRSSYRRSQVLLRDYIHGRKVEQGRKRGPLCGCIRPKTKE